MTETSWAALRGLIAESYEELRARLTRRLGSEDLAVESLNEMWLKLHLSGNAGRVQHPVAFLLTIATNIARDRARGEIRRARRAEIEAALQIGNSATAVGQESETRLALQKLERAILDLPERSRAIFLAARLEGLTHQAIAKRFGISRRTVQYELERTVRALETILGENEEANCASSSPESS